MAPNRKNILEIINSYPDVSGLQIEVQPNKAFAPLTVEEPPSSPISTASETSGRSDSTESYWDWPSGESATEVEEEKVINLFSVKHIEGNLTSAAAETGSSNQVIENDDYWTNESNVECELSNDVVQTTTIPVETSYWEWPAQQDEKKNIIENILREERAFQLVSGSHIEETLVKTPVLQSSKVNPTKDCSDGYWSWETAMVPLHTLDDSHPNHDYWTWSSQEESKSDQKSDLVKGLLEYEAARVLLSAVTVVSQLCENTQTENVEELQGDHDNYWEWSEPLGDGYWEAPQPVTTAASTSESYWDW